MATEEIVKTCDVLVIGAGMAGACLARQLKLEHPQLSIVNIDRKATFDWWVGESTVEVFDDYANRVLKLGPYLTSRHVSKHGLRFFFDSAKHDLPLPKMSEWGPAAYYPMHSSWQIDRSSFDTDLAELNRKLGVEVHLNVRAFGRDGEDVSDDMIRIDPEEGHLVRTSMGTIRCRYLVDAAGRSSPLARKFKLIETEAEEDNLDTGSYWGRFSGCLDVDSFGDTAWHERVNHTQRFRSTNHFMYDGYWIWLIPVSDGIYSIGVCFDRKLKPLSMRSGDELLAFLRQHRVLRDLLPDGAKSLDFIGLKRMARCSKKFVTADRWFLTGMSGFFVDPLLSTSSLSLVTNNRFIGSVIAADLAGDKTLVERRTRHFNIVMRTMYLNLARHLHYDRFGSFDATAGWRTALSNLYYNSLLPLAAMDYKPLQMLADLHDEHCGCSVHQPHPLLVANPVIDRLCDEFSAFLRAKGKYFDRNEGYFCEGTPRMDLVAGVHSMPLSERGAQISLTYQATVRYYVSRICTIEGIPFDEAKFQAAFDPNFQSGQTLRALVDALRGDAPAASPAAPGPAPRRWTPHGPVDEALQRFVPWANRFLDPEGRQLFSGED